MYHKNKILGMRLVVQCKYMICTDKTTGTGTGHTTYINYITNNILVTVDELLLQIFEKKTCLERSVPYE